MSKSPVFVLALSSLIATSAVVQAAPRPNVIIVIADDLGYGDVSAYKEKTTKIKTPNIDRIARNGVLFRHGYATSATSSPSRYGILTGIYPWRNRVDILPGDSRLIIPTDKPTIATMFQSRGYKTAAVGKWHLGLGKGNNNWNAQVSPGPVDIGFKESFIMAATNDRVPCVYFSNGSVVGLDPADPIEVSYGKNFPGEPTGRSNPEMLKMSMCKHHDHHHADSIVSGVPRIGFMKGGKAARWDDSTMADTFSNQALKFIKENKNKPFFMYYALHQPHVPRVANPKFVGKSGLGPRGDVILEADAQVGELLDFLKQNKLENNTLIVFTSDNGPVLDDGYADEAVEKAKEKGHSPTGVFRGGKYSLFEAGTRVPFIVSWPGKVKPGISDVPVSQLDLYASLASLIGGKMPKTLDSENHLDVFLGKIKDKKAGRKNFIVEACQRLAFREGDFIYIPGHNNAWPRAGATGIETGIVKDEALYNLSSDIEQKENLVGKDPKKAAQMREDMLKLTGGRV